MLLIDTDFAGQVETERLVRSALRGSCVVDRIGDPRLGLRLLRQNRHDLYLIGLHSIPDALHLVRAGAGCRGLVIVLTGASDDETELMALGEGAAECIPRPELSEERLRQSILRADARERYGRGAREERVLLGLENDRLHLLQDVSHRLARRSCHDIRSPLTVISAFASILRGELAPDIDLEQAGFFQMIAARVDDVGSLLNDVLNASQLTSDLVGSDREAITVESLVERLRPELGQLAEASGGNLRISMDSPLTQIFCDRGNIEHVLHNLVAAGCKAAGQGGAIDVAICVLPDEKSVRIAVVDDRLAEADAQVIEEPGLQNGRLDERDLRAHVVSEMVRINLGKLIASSLPGRGSSAAFTVPLVDLERILALHLGVLAQGRQTVSQLSVVLARLPPSCGEEDAKKVMKFMRGELRSYDLIVPMQPSVWALCISCAGKDVAEIVARAARSLREMVDPQHADRGPPDLLLQILGSWPLSVAAEHVVATVNSAMSAEPDMRSGQWIARD